jgi:hypothetical protein
MTTQESKQMEQAGTEAVKKLRLGKLQMGFPFMINSKELPKRQSYLEYPDGAIKLVTLAENGTEFITIRTLSKTESIKLRQKFGLTVYDII